MARVIPSRARKVFERGVAYRHDKPVEISDEALYHHLIRTGRFRNVDHTLKPIAPAKGLPRLPPGSLVTVCRECGLGDVLMVLVAIRAMAKRYPALKFSLATGRAYLPLLDGLDFCQVESLMDLRGTRHHVIDLRGLAERDIDRERLERIDIFAKACQVEVHDYRLPTLSVSPDEARAARAMLGKGGVIALAVRGSTHVRTWPIENVQNFALMAALRGWTVAVLDDSRFEMPEHPRIQNLTGQVSLVEAKAIIHASELCISPDSGLQHVAEAVGTRCLAIYSTTPPALRIAHYRYVKAIWRMSLPCVPCFDRGCPAAPCMQIAPEVVLRAVENFDSLPLATNVDANALPVAPVIRIEREAQIMESWPMCAAV